VEALIRPEKLTAVKDALADAGFVGLNVVSVTGRGGQKGIVHQGRGGQPVAVDMLPKVKLELVVSDDDTEKACEVIVETARTGEIGDGKIFVSPVAEVIRVRTGERGDPAL
ncbi:MAG: P-II family nitrogen regulator, partial [SAR202 cluster bacterium]|nr:P-II family nitrogen regulator [SAR202 cluster bacterium]